MLLSTFRRETQCKCKEPDLSHPAHVLMVNSGMNIRIFLWKFNEIQRYSVGGGLYSYSIYLLHIINIY